MHMVLHRARRLDARALAALQRRAIRALCRYSEAQLRGWLSTVTTAYLAHTIACRLSLVAKLGTCVGGFGQLDVARGRLTALYVEPSLTGLGLGRALLDALVQCAGVPTAPVLELSASPNSVGFYERQGFHQQAPRAVAVAGAQPLRVIEMCRAWRIADGS
jgi:GNAT superfamily N-acetyltransferase